MLIIYYIIPFHCSVIPFIGIPIAYFRGRKLDGTKLSLTQNRQVSGYILREIPVEITPVKTVTTISRTTTGVTTNNGNPSSRAAALAALMAEEDNDDDDDGYGGGMGGGFGFDDEEEEEEDTVMKNSNKNNDTNHPYGSRKYAQDDETTNSSSSPSSSHHQLSSSSSVPTSASIGHRAWTIDSTFRSIHDWQFDRTSVEADMIPSALEWIEIARAIHTTND